MKAKTREQHLKKLNHLAKKQKAIIKAMDYHRQKILEIDEQQNVKLYQEEVKKWESSKKSNTP